MGFWELCKTLILKEDLQMSLSAWSNLLGLPNEFMIYMISIAIFLFFLAFSGMLVKLIFWLLKKTGLHTDDEANLFNAFETPLRILLVFLGVYLALRYSQLPARYDAIMIRFLRSLLVLSLAWGLCRLAGSQRFLSGEMIQKLNISSILIPFLSKVSRFIIIALAIVLIAHEWGYDVNGFIAGLGLGGLAFALAAKDALANVFGGIIIVMEKPFVINDWVQTPSVEGIVEEISFRSTRFRTFEQALVTVPNSTLANEPITNCSRMDKRKLSFYISLSYNSSREQMEKVVSRIDQLLHDHDGIDPDDILVRFEKFSESSLDILVNCFTKTTAFSRYVAVREELNLKIMQIVEEEGVSMAFPTRSLFMENLPEFKIK
jgi:MscS family membrane protein